MASIYELNQQFLDFKRFIETVNEGEDTIDEQTILDTLEGMEGEFEEKIKGYAAVYKELMADVEAMKQAEKSIAERRKVLENRVKKIATVINDALQLRQIPEIKDAFHQIGYRRCPPSVEVVSEGEIPAFLWIPQDPQLDKKTALQLLKDGEEVPGLRLVTDKKNLFIK